MNDTSEELIQAIIRAEISERRKKFNSILASVHKRHRQRKSETQSSQKKEEVY